MRLTPPNTISASCNRAPGLGRIRTQTARRATRSHAGSPGRLFLILVVALPLLWTIGCRTTHPDERAELLGCFWWVSPGPEAGTLDLGDVELDAMQALGMNVVVLNGLWVGQPLKAGESDSAERLFQEGDRRGLTFFVDTLAAPQWWTLHDPAAELDRARERIGQLHARYGHHQSFGGFYVPYEVYVMWGTQRELIRVLYREVAAACKRVAPAKPVLISPFFILDQDGVLGDFRWATPEEYETFWAEVLRESPVDIVALQDRGAHLSYYTDAQCAPFFAAMKNAVDATGKQLWANVETGELEVASAEAYTARFGPRTHVNDPRTQPAWRGVPPDKLMAKLRFVRRYTPTAITWGYREFVRPSLGAAQAELYAEYCDRLGRRAKPARPPGAGFVRSADFPTWP